MFILKKDRIFKFEICVIVNIKIKRNIVNTQDQYSTFVYFTYQETFNIYIQYKNDNLKLNTPIK